MILKSQRIDDLASQSAVRKIWSNEIVFLYNKGNCKCSINRNFKIICTCYILKNTVRPKMLKELKG
jgi:hypothetical protein